VITLQLLAAGASKTAVDRQGLTAEHYAYKFNHLNMVLYKGLSTVAHESSSSIEKAKRRTSITSLANSSNSSVLAAGVKIGSALPPLHVSTGTFDAKL
jgi:ankyrin repeat protein